jgi:hypothetical protein
MTIFSTGRLSVYPDLIPPPGVIYVQPCTVSAEREIQRYAWDQLIAKGQDSCLIRVGFIRRGTDTTEFYSLDRTTLRNCRAKLSAAGFATAIVHDSKNKGHWGERFAYLFITKNPKKSAGLPI